jgi:DNA end-binding protein Ku
MDKVAIGTVVLTSREHIIGLEPLGKGLMGTLIRYPYEVRDEKEYFDDIQDVKVTKDMLDLAKHIVNQKAADFEPERFEDHYEEALTELINAKRQGKTVGPRARPSGGNVVDLMDALKKSLETEAATSKGKKPRKATAGQKENAFADRGAKVRREEGGQAGAVQGTQKSRVVSGDAALPLQPQATGCASVR